MSRKRIVVVTGASGGIGLATAQRFLREGNTVHGLDQKEPSLAVAADFQFHRSDVSVEEDVAHVIAAIDRAEGRIDVLVNVAGIVLVKPIEETGWKEFCRIAEVNLGGTFLLIKHVVPVMKRVGTGVIVNVSSVSAHVGQVNHSLYGATKAGVSALTRALAWELSKSGIRVNAVSPGSVDTPMLQSDVKGEANRLGESFENLRKLREAEQALGRWASPAEIASVIWFLASDDASFMTGADVLADGGWVAR